MGATIPITLPLSVKVTLPASGAPLLEATLQQEETRFRQTLVTGLKLLDEATADLAEGGTLAGETAYPGLRALVASFHAAVRGEAPTPIAPERTLHIARALVAEDLLQADPLTKRYRLGVGMLPLARAVLENSDFPNLVRPKLDDLSSRYGVMAIGVEYCGLFGSTV